MRVELLKLKNRKIVVSELRTCEVRVYKGTAVGEWAGLGGGAIITQTHACKAGLSGLRFSEGDQRPSRERARHRASSANEGGRGLGQASESRASAS